ncbi:MAG: glycosyltransferase [Methanoregula sp.]|nr:glycosyltransferase [Methanoregula sp.]
MKIAIFHDYFGTIGGGEKVVVAMAKALDADIITTDTTAIRKIDSSVRVICLGKTLKYPGLKQISATLKFYFCDVSKEYDFFIFSGNWGHYAAHRHHPNLWYCHTPVRVFYDQYDSFAERLNPVVRLIFRIGATFGRSIDIRSMAHINRILTNSRNVQDRIFRYLHRTSRVIYPPIDTSRYTCKEFGNYWLSVNRVYPEKRIELQIETFRQLPDQHLVIVGGWGQGDHSAQYARIILENLPSNVTFMGEVPETKLLELYACCRALICTSADEDFGLTPLEAMASGKPVVAVDEGGFTETVTPETGILVDPDRENLIRAVRQISENPEKYSKACIARAREFDHKEFSKILNDMIKTSQDPS